MDGLQYCRNLLANSTTNDRIIILVTDGSPTRPLNPDGTDGYDYAKEKATETATMVKEDDGTTLMTVAVGTSPYTSKYLAELASDAEFAFKVENFDDLDAISGGYGKVRVGALFGREIDLESDFGIALT